MARRGPPPTQWSGRSGRCRALPARAAAARRGHRCRRRDRAAARAQQPAVAARASSRCRRRESGVGAHLDGAAGRTVRGRVRTAGDPVAGTGRGAAAARHGAQQLADRSSRGARCRGPAGARLAGPQHRQLHRPGEDDDDLLRPRSACVGAATGAGVRSGPAGRAAFPRPARERADPRRDPRLVVVASPL